MREKLKDSRNPCVSVVTLFSRRESKPRVAVCEHIRTHARTHDVSDNEDAEGRTPGVAPTIRMLSGLSDVVLTHVHRSLEGVERAQRRVTPEAPEVSAVARRGDAINLIETREVQASGQYCCFFLRCDILPRDDITVRHPARRRCVVPLNFRETEISKTGACGQRP